MYNWEHKRRMHGYRHGFRFPWVALVLVFAFVMLASGGWRHWGFFGWPMLFAVPLICVAPFILAFSVAMPHLKRWCGENAEFGFEGKRKRNEMFDSLFSDDKPKHDEKPKRGDSGDNDNFYV